MSYVNKFLTLFQSFFQPVVNDGNKCLHNRCLPCWECDEPSMSAVSQKYPQSYPQLLRVKFHKKDPSRGSAQSRAGFQAI